MWLYSLPGIVHSLFPIPFVSEPIVFTLTTDVFVILPPVPTRLNYSNQPSGGRSSDPWVTYPRIQLLDMVDDVIDIDDESVVTLTLYEVNFTEPLWRLPADYNPAKSLPPTPPILKPVLNGTLTKVMSGGWANFTDLTINKV